MQEWFCRKCKSRAMTQESNPKCSVLDNGVIHRIDGQVCATCTERLKSCIDVASPQGDSMTSSANDEWNHFHLTQGIEQLRKDCRKIRHLAVDKLAGIEQAASLIHTIDFIEYNMREMEITGGNGD